MWGELVAALQQFDDAVLSAVGPDGFPVSVRVRPQPDAAAEVLLLADELPVSFVAGPASLLCHSHDRQLWHLRSLLVRGVLVRGGPDSERGWVLQPTALVPGTGMAGPLGDARTFLAARQRAGRYLTRRGMQRPVVPWADVQALRRSVRQARPATSASKTNPDDLGHS